MKTNLACVGLVALLASGTALAAEPIIEQQTSQLSYPVSTPTPRLHVRNIWGNVTVRAGTSREITVTLNERRTASTQEDFDRLKQHVRLNIEANGESVSMIVGDPDKSSRRMDVCRGCRVDYQFEITAPPDALIDVGTITDGRVEVTGIRGPVNASNVNGPVTVTDLNDCAKIKSVNGALNLKFARAPGQDCALETINGRITVGLPANAGLDAVLNINDGEIESDFDAEPMTLPAKSAREDKEDRFGYRLEQPAGVRLGAGGPTFTFASLNGDVRIRKNK
jgi:hypothetical protein